MKDYLKLLKEAVGGDKEMGDIHAEIAKFFVKNPTPSEEDINQFCEELGINIDEFNKHLHMIMGELSKKGLLRGYVSEHALNELFISIADIDKLEGDEMDKQALRLSIIAEQDAVNLYRFIASKTQNLDVRKVMNHVAQEEKVHVGEFETVLKKLDPEYEPSVEEGEKEANEEMGVEE